MAGKKKARYSMKEVSNWGGEGKAWALKVGALCMYIHSASHEKILCLGFIDFKNFPPRKQGKAIQTIGYLSKKSNLLAKGS